MDKKVELLIVEDDDGERELMCTILKDEDYSVSVAHSSSDALGKLETISFDIIVLDIRLDTLNGFDICHIIRSRYYDRPLQIVLISGFTDAAYLKRALEVGGDDFIKKPISPLDLQARIKAAEIRLNNQREIYKEREYYKRIAQKQEEFSTKVLEQNLELKEAFEKISKMYKELEHTNQELERLAKYDMLSGLLNRPTLFSTLDVEIERSLRTELPLSGIMLDLDHFKTVNDNYGHQCGDTVIRSIGHCLKDGLRKYDFAGRYGGEEFFIILPNTTIDQASIIAERFREKIEQLSIDCSGETVAISASLGIAQFREGESREMWLSRTDKAMYMSKQLGRTG